MLPRKRDFTVIPTLCTILGLIGLIIGYSALQHWFGGAPLREHYQSIPLGAGGQFIVAAAQSTAAVFLLWPKFQVLAGFILGSILLVISARSVVINGLQAAFWMPFILAVLAIFAAALLRHYKRRAMAAQAKHSVPT